MEMDDELDTESATNSNEKKLPENYKKTNLETVSTKAQNPSISKNHNTNEYQHQKTSSSKNMKLFNGTAVALNQTSTNCLSLYHF